MHTMYVMYTDGQVPVIQQTDKRRKDFNRRFKVWVQAVPFIMNTRSRGTYSGMHTMSSLIKKILSIRIQHNI